MKHPHTGKILVEVGVAKLQKDAIKNPKVTLLYFSVDGGKKMWVTPQDFALLTGGAVEYPFDESGNLSTEVDYEDGVVHVHERAGWGRTYTKTFADLEDLAEKWGVEFDVGDTTEAVAAMGTRLMMAEEMAGHGLRPNNFLPVPPRHLKALKLISDYYGDDTTARSGVPLVNHIRDGLEILKEIGASDDAMSAFCLHPIFQSDNDLLQNRDLIAQLDPLVAALVMEYRSQANRALSDRVAMEYGPMTAETGLVRRPRWSGSPPTPGPLEEVRDMLIADKVQNFADFEEHHLGRHARSDELEHYFECWLCALGITAQQYAGLKVVMRRWKK